MYNIVSSLSSVLTIVTTSHIVDGSSFQKLNHHRADPFLKHTFNQRDFFGLSEGDMLLRSTFLEHKAIAVCIYSQSDRINNKSYFDL